MVHGKPIIVHTIEQFEYHDEIDGIVVVCIKDWIPYMEEMKYRYRLDKIGKIVPGGATGQMSIYNGLCAAEEIYGAKNNIVLMGYKNYFVSIKILFLLLQLDHSYFGLWESF